MPRDRGYIQQKNILHIALQHATLDGSTYSYDLIRVHTLGRSAAEGTLTVSWTLGIRVMPPTRSPHQFRST